MILVLLKLKYPYQSKVVNTCLILFEVHVSYTVEARKYHTNCRLTFEFTITVFHVFQLDLPWREHRVVVKQS